MGCDYVNHPYSDDSTSTALPSLSKLADKPRYKMYVFNVLKMLIYIQGGIQHTPAPSPTRGSFSRSYISALRHHNAGSSVCRNLGGQAWLPPDGFCFLPAGCTRHGNGRMEVIILCDT
ncbi:hypothetical protein EON64_03025 [archaeon]|nr:MAG: hypothetical protein EON64_03025 [archaeon]